MQWFFSSILLQFLHLSRRFFAPLPIAFYYWWYLFTVHECACLYVGVCVTCHSGTSFMKFTFIATHWQTHKLKTAKQMRESGRERGKYHVHFWLTFWFVDFILFVFGLKFWLTVALGAVGGVWNLHSTCLILFEFATVDTRHSWTNNRGGGEEREEQERITRDWEKFERICSKSKSIEFSSAIDAVTCRLALSLSLAIPLFEPHFPFVILHSFCQFLCRSSSLKTNDVIGQFSTLPSRLFTRVTTTTTITTTTVLHNLAFCYTC